MKNSYNSNELASQVGLEIIVNMLVCFIGIGNDVTETMKLVLTNFIHSPFMVHLIK